MDTERQWTVVYVFESCTLVLYALVSESGIGIRFQNRVSEPELGTESIQCIWVSDIRVVSFSFPEQEHGDHFAKLIGEVRRRGERGRKEKETQPGSNAEGIVRRSVWHLRKE